MEINCAITCPETAEIKCKFPLSVSPEDTVQRVKELIQSEIGLQESHQQLVYADKVMKNEEELSEYGVTSGSTIQLTILKLQNSRVSDVSINSGHDEIPDRFQKNYCKFMDAISNPSMFAARLYSAGLITQDVLEYVENESREPCQKKLKLMSAIRGPIKAYPEETLRKLVEILCEEPCYHELAKSLNFPLAEELISQQAEIDLVSEGGYDNNGTKPEAEGLASHQQAITLTEIHGAPHGQASASESNEVVLKKPVAHEITEGTECHPACQLLTMEECYRQIREFEDRFADLTDSLQEELQELVRSGKRLALVKNSVVRLPNEIKHEHERFLERIIAKKDQILKGCEDVEDLFYLLNDYWNCFDFSLVEHLVRKFASDDLRQTMQKYIADMKEFRQNTPVSMFAQIWRLKDELPREKFTVLKAKLKKDMAQCTLEELDGLRKDFCVAYHLSESALMVYKLSAGSINIEWLMPITLKGILMRTIKRNPIEVFCISRNIGSLSVGKDKVYDDMVFEEVTVPGQESLIQLLSKRGSECLNQMEEHPYTHALTPGPLQYLESDLDQQLIIFLKFQTTIKLHSIQLTGPLDGRSPRTVKLFINQPSTIDFDRAERSTALQEFSLTEKEVSEDAVIPLQFVKYQSVSNLTIFVKDNQGDRDTTVIHHIGLFGSSVEALDMSYFRRVSGMPGEEHLHSWHYRCPKD